MIPYGAMRANVVVTGMGCVSSLGIGADTFVDRLLAGQSGIRPITAFSTDGCRSHTAALLRDFDAGRYYDPMKLRRVDEVGRLGLVSSRLAIDDAGLPTNTDEVGVVLGPPRAASTAPCSTCTSSPRRPDGRAGDGLRNTIANAAASLCSIEFGLRGPNVTIGQKQASALAAIAFAMAGLRQGRASAFVCGGIDDFEERFFTVHDRMRVLSPAGGGEEASRPFDARRNGFVLGTGGHVMVLETAASAARRRRERRTARCSASAPARRRARSDGWPTEPSGIVRHDAGRAGRCGCRARRRRRRLRLGQLHVRRSTVSRRWRSRRCSARAACRSCRSRARSASSARPAAPRSWPPCSASPRA